MFCVEILVTKENIDEVNYVLDFFNKRGANEVLLYAKHLSHEDFDKVRQILNSRYQDFVLKVDSYIGERIKMQVPSLFEGLVAIIERSECEVTG